MKPSPLVIMRTITQDDREHMKKARPRLRLSIAYGECRAALKCENTKKVIKPKIRKAMKLLKEAILKQEGVKNERDLLQLWQRNQKFKP